jgi:hypothetical protein
MRIANTARAVVDKRLERQGRINLSFVKRE